MDVCTFLLFLWHWNWNPSEGACAFSFMLGFVLILVLWKKAVNNRRWLPLGVFKSVLGAGTSRSIHGTGNFLYVVSFSEEIVWFWAVSGSAELYEAHWTVGLFKFSQLGHYNGDSKQFYTEQLMFWNLTKEKEIWNLDSVLCIFLKTITLCQLFGCI